MAALSADVLIGQTPGAEAVIIAVQMTISAGSRIGAYEVIGPLGEGGMGVVLRGRDTRLQRDVALKLLPDHLATDPDRLFRFQREAQILASLNHPHIAQVFGLEQADGSTCIVMELVEGDTLADRLKSGPMSFDDARGVAVQLAEALAAAHERGIVHRDLKPANIKLSASGVVKVLDFGLAKALGSGPADAQATVAANRAHAVDAGHDPRARPATCRPSRRAARTWTPAPTSGRSAACSTRC